MLAHALPDGDLAQVLDRALDALIAKLEQNRFAPTTRTRPVRQRRAEDSRYVPAEIRRAVWQRDGGRCTFVGDTGHRCEARTRLEFDHVEPFARGGQATLGGLRLRCRAHNQYTAERAFGVGFMTHKREESRRRAAVTRSAWQSEAEARAREAALAREAAQSLERERAVAARARADEVIPWLRALGVNVEDARSAAAPCAEMPDDTPLEARVRVALRSLAPHRSRRAVHAPSTAV